MKTMKSIKKEGGKCEKIATDYWECTDKNGKVWWCSDGGKTCVKKPISITPDHDGTCPYCKEEIHDEALKCKHCGSSLLKKSESNCGCGQKTNNLGNVPQTIYDSQSGQSSNDYPIQIEMAGALFNTPGINIGGNPGLGIDGNCRYKMVCENIFGIPFCRLKYCCFSDTKGTWGCL